MTDCSKIPTLALVEDAKKGMNDIVEFASSENETYVSELDGETQKTIQGVIEDAKTAYRLASENPQGAYGVGVVYEESNWVYTYNNESWGLSDTFDLSLLPYTATEADPNNDSNLMQRRDATQSYVQTKDTKAQEELLPVGSGIYPDVGTVENGDAVTPGTTHLRVNIEGNPKVVAMSPISSGVVSGLSESGVTVGGVSVEFRPPLLEVRSFNEINDLLSYSGLLLDGDFVYVSDIDLFLKVTSAVTDIQTNGGNYLQATKQTVKISNISSLSSVATALFTEGSVVSWSGYYSDSDGGGNWGVVKTGAHTEDKGIIFSITPTLYIEANVKPSIATNAKKFGLVGDDATDDTLQAQRWIASGGKLRGMKGETYIVKGEMQLIENSDVDLNGSSWKFETIENVRNFVIATGSKLHNGEIYADHDPTSPVSATTGGRAVGIYGLSSDTVTNPNNISRWEVSNLKIYGGQVYTGGSVSMAHPILILGDVSEGKISNIEIDGRGVTNLGVHMEWRADENFVDDVNVKIKLPRNIEVSGVKFRNGDTSANEGHVVGCSGAYNITYKLIDASECYTVAIASMGEAGPAYCQGDDVERINTGNKFSQVKGVNVLGYAAQCFGKGNPSLSGTDNIPRGDVKFEQFRVTGTPVDGDTIDGIFNSGMFRVEIDDSSLISKFSRYGVYVFNGAKETNVNDSTLSSNGYNGIYYIGNLSDDQYSEGTVSRSYIHSNGQFATTDAQRAGILGFYARNIKSLFNKFGSGLIESGVATQLSCVRAGSSVYPRYWQIIGNYSELDDTGIDYIWYTDRAAGSPNDETYRILVSNNMILNGAIQGTYLTTTDGL